MQEDTTLRPGDSFRIVCVVSGQPKPNVTWTKVGDSSLPWNIEVDGRDHSITISNANAINNGIYECRAESAIGSSTSIIHLKISASPRITIDAPNKIPHVGDMVVLKCLVLEGKSIDLTWYKIKDDSKTKVANGSELRYNSLIVVMNANFLFNVNKLLASREFHRTMQVNTSAKHPIHMGRLLRLSKWRWCRFHPFKFSRKGHLGHSSAKSMIFIATQAEYRFLKLAGLHQEDKT